MNVLLVNPNQFRTPPVIPIGLEYFTDSLRKADHHVQLLDLCFSDYMEENIASCMNKERFDLIGITLRNVDSVLFFNNEFYLPKIKDIVQIYKKYNVPIVIGGAGLIIDPEIIIEYLNVDYRIIGPGENTILELLNFSHFLIIFNPILFKISKLIDLLKNRIKHENIRALGSY